MKLFGNPSSWQSHDRLAPQARAAIEQAEAAAALRGLREAPPDLLLLALLEQPESAAARAATILAADVAAVRQAIDAGLRAGPTALTERSSLDAAAREAVVLGLNEARRGGFAQVGAGHLLLGLLEARDGAGVRALAQQGLGVKELRPLVQGLEEQAAGDHGSFFVATFASFLEQVGGGYACPHCQAPLHVSFRHCYVCGADLTATQDE